MPAELVSLERDPDRGSPTAGVVTLTLHPGSRPVVVLDSAMLHALDSALESIAAGPAPAGLVLASEGRVFIAGANLEEIMALDDAGLHAYLEFGSAVYAKLATMPCTTVAAINGATLGGGLEVAMHCDRLIAQAPPVKDGVAKPYQIGLPEAGLAICPGWGGTVMLPARMDAAKAIGMTATGKTMAIDAALTEGLVESLVEASDLLGRARLLAVHPKAARRIEPISVAEPSRRERGAGGLATAQADLPGAASARAVAECVRIGITRGWQAALKAERDALVRLRGSPEGRSAIEAFFAKSAAKA